MHANSLAKIQVCELFREGDILRNVLLKFTVIMLSMETPCLCPKANKTCHRAESAMKTPVGLINIF